MYVIIDLLEIEHENGKEDKYGRTYSKIRKSGNEKAS